MAAKAKQSQAVSDSKTGGRPRGPWAEKLWRDAIRKAVMRAADEGKGKKLDQLALSLVKAGCTGDVSALREIGDRLDGKVPQAITGEGGAAIALAISWQPPSAL